VENWQTSFIVNINSGSPSSLSAANMLYGNGVADIVEPFDPKAAQVTWDGQFGNYFGSGQYIKVTDPQCAEQPANLRSFCTLQAVQDTTTGQIVLQNPRPGKRGTLGRQVIELPGQWNFDAAISKTFRITEQKNLQFRMDATNILNHRDPAFLRSISTAPTLSD
jgi:hypothetical protein